MAHPSPVHTEAHDDAPPIAPALSGREVWRLVAPWLGHAFLAAAAVLGLFTASGAEGATYETGIATFVVAAILIFVRMKRQLDGREIGFLLPVASTDIDSLLVTVVILAVLGLIGVTLAATVGGELYGVGLALFLVAVAIIFSNIKRYFDLRDGGDR